MAILQAWPKVFLILLFFLQLQRFEQGQQDFESASVTPAPRMRSAPAVQNPRINEQVTSFFFSSGSFFANLLVGCFAGQSLCILIGATMDEGFVARC